MVVIPPTSNHDAAMSVRRGQQTAWYRFAQADRAPTKGAGKKQEKRQEERKEKSSGEAMYSQINIQEVSQFCILWGREGGFRPNIKREILVRVGDREAKVAPLFAKKRKGPDMTGCVEASSRSFLRGRPSCAELRSPGPSGLPADQ